MSDFCEVHIPKGLIGAIKRTGSPYRIALFAKEIAPINALTDDASFLFTLAQSRYCIGYGAFFINAIAKAQ